MKHRSILLQFAPGVRARRRPCVRRWRKHEKERKDAFSVDHEELLFVDCDGGGLRASQHDQSAENRSQQASGHIESSLDAGLLVAPELAARELDARAASNSAQPCC